MSSQLQFVVFNVLCSSLYTCEVSVVSAQSGLSELDMQELLDAHNLFRSIVDPPATDMQRMVCQDSYIIMHSVCFCRVFLMVCTLDYHNIYVAME